MKHLLKIIAVVILPVSVTAILHSCKKSPTLPTVSTASVTGITQTTALSGGNVTDDGGAEVTKRGLCCGTSPNPTTLAPVHTIDGAGIGIFTSNLTGLTANTRYFVRAWALNSEGISYGNENSFITSPISLSTIETLKITSITSSTAVCGGNITYDGASSVVDRGICWSTNQNPTTNDNRTSLGTGTGSFTSGIGCLSFATTYYVRAYAINDAGISYGDQQILTTPGTNPIIFNPDLIYGSVTDIDGNCYKTIQIGTGIWMAENLRTSRYNDGTPIPDVTDNSEWENLLSDIAVGPYITTGAFCWYENDSSRYENGYGKLYNYGAVNSGKLCPSGWHVPNGFLSGLDGYPMSEYCYNSSYLGGRMMETGSGHWHDPLSSCITNETGFTVLPGGKRNSDGTFTGTGTKAFFWTTIRSGHGPLAVYQVIPFSAFFGGSPTSCSILPTNGLSIRCVKDN